MSTELIVRHAGLGVTVQDLGREGYLSHGLSRGGAADPVAHAEGAALLGQAPGLASVEIAASAIEIETTAPVWVALTGAPMAARYGASDLAWNASHLLGTENRLRIGSLRSGNYAYLHVAGGIDTPVVVGGRGVHLAAGLGRPVASGDTLPAGAGPGPERTPMWLPAGDRFGGGEIRMMAGPQTDVFPQSVLRRFLDTPFVRTAWGNRQGIRLSHDGKGFRPAEGLNLVSEFITPGDIQITGDGTPYVLGPECQTIGGYPRIGTVLPQDLSRVMQANAGSELTFRLVTLEEASAGLRTPEALVGEIRAGLLPLVRDPRLMPDLLSYEFISGVTAGSDPSDEEPKS